MRERGPTHAEKFKKNRCFTKKKKRDFSTVQRREANVLVLRGNATCRHSRNTRENFKKGEARFEHKHIHTNHSYCITQLKHL